MPTLPALRSLLWLGFFAVILAAWWAMFDMAGAMRPGAMAPMTMEMAAPGYGTLAAMWAIMMAAMMLPTLVPTLRAYDDLIVSANGSRAGWLGVIGGFLAVWVGFALVIAAAQVALTATGLLDAMGAARSVFLAAALLVLAGLYQFSRAKAICHGVCHAPAAYFFGHWRPGPLGGARMGVGLGVYCVGCCWAIMALGFVGGAMNLWWMGLATAFMVIEKLPQVARHVTRPGGAALILAGGLVALHGAGLI